MRKRIRRRLFAGIIAAFLCAVTTTALAIEPIACLAEDSLPEAIYDARIIILGEIHGTEESPRFAAQLLCALADNGRTVVLGLEILDWEQPTLDDYLQDLSREDFVPSADSIFWASPVLDGRSSKAMAELISQVKAFRSLGMQIDIVAFDGAVQDDQNRDDVMASNIRKAIMEREGSQLLLLTGRVHAFQTLGAPFDAGFRSMANQLSEYSPLSLLMTHAGGTAWTCHGAECSTFELEPDRSQFGDPNGRIVLQTVDDGRFDGYYVVDHITASPPAVR